MGGAVPFHQHALCHELIDRAPELASGVLKRAGSKAWGALLDMDACMAVFRTLAEQETCGDLRAVIVNDSHLLVYNIGAPWFMPGFPLLVEQFYMRVGRGCSDEALHTIDGLALQLGCKGVLMATSLAANDHALGRLLGRSGYSPESSQHLKVL